MYRKRNHRDLFSHSRSTNSGTLSKNQLYQKPLPKSTYIHICSIFNEVWDNASKINDILLLQKKAIWIISLKRSSDPFKPFLLIYKFQLL